MVPADAIAAIEKLTPETLSFFTGGEPEKTLKTFTRLLHPDRFGTDKVMAERAEAALLKLTALCGKPAEKPITIGKWTTTGTIAKGDIADLHAVEGKEGRAVMKIARSARNNDLLDTEANVLKRLAEGDDLLARYFPKPLDSMMASGRRANVMSRADGYITLVEICQRIRHDKFDFRHVVWMVNRALSALGYAHRQGIIHGAINATHLLYNPADHGMVLVDWCYAAAKPEAKIPAIVAHFRADYPPEVTRKMVPGPWTDLFMLARTMQRVAKVPREFQPLFELCLIQSPASRPCDAYEFQDRWVATAAKLYGPPAFVPLVIPNQ